MTVSLQQLRGRPAAVVLHGVIAKDQQPAASVPCGLTKAGLPAGLQIVGPLYADALVLRAAQAFEEAAPFVMPKI